MSPTPLLKGSDVPIEVGVLLVHLAQGLGRAYWGRCFTGAPCSRAWTCLLRSVFYWCTLLKGSDLPIEVGVLLVQFGPDALPAATNDSYRHQQEMITGSRSSSPVP